MQQVSGMCQKSLLILRRFGGFLIIIDVLRHCKFRMWFVIIVLTVVMLILHLHISVAFHMMRWIMTSDTNVNVKLKIICD